MSVTDHKLENGKLLLFLDNTSDPVEYSQLYEQQFKAYLTKRFSKTSFEQLSSYIVPPDKITAHNEFHEYLCEFTDRNIVCWVPHSVLVNLAPNLLIQYLEINTN